MTMGAPMRYALAVASFLACWSGGAFGAEMPKELWGHWCNVEQDKLDKWKQCKEGLHERSYYFIDKAGTFIEEASCKPLDVRKVADNTWIVKKRCTVEGLFEVLTPTTRFVRKGDYLYREDLP
jgi:hypothetical protein